MSDWQPIETAPKGERILAYDGFWVFEGYWFDGLWWHHDTRATPTHWMPLPEPPYPPAR